MKKVWKVTHHESKCSAKPQTLLIFYHSRKTTKYLISTTLSPCFKTHFRFGATGENWKTQRTITYDEARKQRGNENSTQTRCSQRKTQLLLVMAHIRENSTKLQMTGYEWVWVCVCVSVCLYKVIALSEYRVNLQWMTCEWKYLYWFISD